MKVFSRAARDLCYLWRNAQVSIPEPPQHTCSTFFLSLLLTSFFLCGLISPEHAVMLPLLTRRHHVQSHAWLCFKCIGDTELRAAAANDWNVLLKTNVNVTKLPSSEVSATSMPQCASNPAAVLPSSQMFSTRFKLRGLCHFIPSNVSFSLLPQTSEVTAVREQEESF